ncbi:twin-arginine translocase TatA/TatE family subunit [Pseudomonas sp. NCCP-436]|uniref:twin-arginine translocase TatA/TatE family subunit n=1 Tax=Pseudomonas sp. NCCP-436 TaxID=2842481 RepID=UPI001C812D32|nr:twin-arginine translocase TatA/TatE family subunit [Pseudomonas sp. NCCP-436]GIZ10987.1 Sec-independent protein translocase protein TatA [Pseudomonas sp. NCCP-436]
MGIAGISIWQLLIILLIVIMLFGSKRLRTLGSDLGDAIGGFRRSLGSNGEVATITQEGTSSMKTAQEKQEHI